MRSYTFVLVLLLISANARAIEPITVMVILDNNVPLIAKTRALDEINEMMVNTGLLGPGYAFIDADPNSNYTVNCGTGDHLYFIDCAQSSYYVAQGNINADLVIVVAPVVQHPEEPRTICGGVEEEGLLNLEHEFLINRMNYEHSWATVSNACFGLEKVFPASHEVGHLLYIEHEDFDDEYNKPVRHNHAATDEDKGTAVATKGDCRPQWTACNEWENRLSAKGAVFTGGGSAGDSDRAP